MAAAVPVAARRLVLAWTVVALAVRGGALLWAGPHLACAYDECSYLKLATALAEGAGWMPEKGFLWPPGYTLFLAALAPGAGPAAARWAQTLLGAALLWPAAAFAAAAAAHLPVRRQRLALHVTCGFMALDPTLVAYSHLLWPETLFLVLLTSALVLVATASAAPRALLAGMLLGAAGLTKAIGFWMAWPFAAVAAASAGRRRLAVGAALVGGALLVVLPWTARNAAAYGRFLLIDATAGTNLYLGNSDAPPVTWDWGAGDRSRARGARERCLEGDFIQRDRCEQRRAAAWIAAHPLSFARRAFTKWADLVNPTSFLVRHVRSGRYGALPMHAVSPVAAALATAAAAIPWMALVLLAALGLALSPSSPPRRITLAVVLVLLAATALTFGMSRFRLPAVPLLAAYAGIGVACLAEGRWFPDGAGRRWVLLASVTMMVVLWAARLPQLVDFAPLLRDLPLPPDASATGAQPEDAVLSAPAADC